MYRSRSRKKYVAWDYLLPFLIILAGFIILVLIFNLAKSFFVSDKKQAAYMHIVEGSVQMRTWGTSDFLTINSDALIMEGDEIVSSVGSKVIVEFFDGTIMRLSSLTDLAFEEISGEGTSSSIGVVLVDGEIWINKVYGNKAIAQVSVKAGSSVIRSGKDTIFDVKKGSDVSVVGVQGESIFVDVLDKAGKKVVETEQIGVGQEITLNAKALDRYWKYQSPSVVTAISDEFKMADWYLWNKEEDKNPTQFEKSAGLVKVEPQNVELVEPEKIEEEIFPEDLNGEDMSEESLEEPSFVEVGGAFSAPLLTSVTGQTTPNSDGFFVITSNIAVITGTVQNTAAKISVNDYILQKFALGNTTWTYYANADYGLMSEGKNIYEIYAYDQQGNKSEKLTVKILYQPKKSEQPAEQTPEVTEQPAEPAAL